MYNSHFSDPVQNKLPALCESRQVVAVLLCVREKGALEYFSPDKKDSTSLIFLFNISLNEGLCLVF